MYLNVYISQETCFITHIHPLAQTRPCQTRGAIIKCSRGCFEDYKESGFPQPTLHYYAVFLSRCGISWLYLLCFSWSIQLTLCYRQYHDLTLCDVKNLTSPHADLQVCRYLGQNICVTLMMCISLVQALCVKKHKVSLSPARCGY